VPRGLRGRRRRETESLGGTEFIGVSVRGPTVDPEGAGAGAPGLGTGLGDGLGTALVQGKAWGQAWGGLGEGLGRA